MKIINGERCYQLREIAKKINIPHTTLYVRWKANYDEFKKGGVSIYPKPISQGKAKYWKEEDVPYFAIAKDNELSKGKTKRYKSSYQKLQERIEELEKELREAKKLNLK